MTSKAQEAALRAKRRMRNVSIAGAVVVFVVAGWDSYWHGVDVTTRLSGDHTWHTWWLIHIFPLAPDGLMAIAAVAMIAHPVRGFSDAKLGFWAGLGFSLAMNLMATTGQASLAWFALALVWNASPAIIMMVAAHILLRQFVPASPRRKRKAPAKPAQRAAGASSNSRHRSVTPQRTLSAVGN